MKSTGYKNPVTIQTIAKKAKVSHATVSVVMNQRGGELRIKPDTQRRILEIAKQLDYRPNQLARGLSGKRTNTIGILWSLCGPHDSAGMARDIALQAHQRGFVTFIADSLSDPVIMKRALNDFSQRQVDGVVMQVGQPDLLRQADIARHVASFPASVVVASAEADIESDHVIHRFAPALREAVNHLHAIGRRSLAFLGGAGASRNKVDFIRQACQVWDMDLRVIDAPHGSRLRPEEFWAALDQAGDQRFDALFCGCDEIAGAALGWLQTQGKRVPDDVALIGFNDSPMTRFLTPPLASVDRHDESLAKLIGQMLFRRLEEPSLPVQRQQADTSFVWRPSAGGIALGQTTTKTIHANPRIGWQQLRGPKISGPKEKETSCVTSQAL